MPLGRVLLFWLVSFLWHERFFAQGSSLGTYSEEMWPSYTATLVNEWIWEQDTQAHPLSSLDSSLVSSEGTVGPPAGTASSTVAPAEGSAEGPGSRAAHGVSPRRHFPWGLSVLLALLICVSLLTVNLKQPSVHKADIRTEAAATETPSAEVPKEPESAKGEEPIAEPLEGPQVATEDRTAEICARLEKVRGLLPVAKKLASLVAWTESKQLLSRVQESVGALEAQPAETQDSKNLEEALENGLDALRKLHEAAIERADAIMQTEISRSASGLMGLDVEEAPEAISEIDEEIEAETVRPFMTFLHSLHERDDGLCCLLGNVRVRLSKGGRFADEQDERLLQAAAEGLEFLYAASESRTQVIRTSEILHKSVFGGLRDLFCMERHEVFMQLYEALALLHLFADLERAGERATRDAAETASPPDAEEQTPLNTLERGLREVAELLPQLSAEAEVMGTATTPVAVFAANARAERLEKQARSLLEMCWKTAGTLPNLPERLSMTHRQVVMRAALSAHKHVVSKANTVKGILSDIAESTSKAAPGRHPSTAHDTQHLNASIRAALLASAGEAADQANMVARDAEELVQILKQLDQLKPTMEYLQRLTRNAIRIGEEEEKVRLLLQRSRLLSFLESDMNYGAIVASRAGSHEVDLSSPVYQKMADLQRQLNAALTAAEKASTLMEAADTVAAVRRHADALQYLQ